MSFAAAVEHLHALGQELSFPGASRRKFDLAHMRTLAAALGDPQLRFPSVLIAGTNGKGSTAATLAHIAAAAGLRAGLYTSPHLVRVTERIRTNTHAGPPSTTLDEIPEDTFARLFFRVDDTARVLVAHGRLPHPPSYFETLTALAFLFFAEQHLDLAILEVGLGGRLDATNIVEPALSILTDIALDHQEYLGSTIGAIAREKAGILRPNGTLITLPQHPEANQAIGEAAVALDVHGINAADFLPGRDFTRHVHRETVTPTEAKDPLLPPREAQSPGAPITAQSQRDVSGIPHSPLPPNTYTLQLEGSPLHVRSPLFGEHQQRNLALAIAAAVELRTHHALPIPNAAIEAGIAHTRWPGRLELLTPALLAPAPLTPARLASAPLEPAPVEPAPRPPHPLGPDLLLDVAHNPAGAWTLRAALAALPESRPRTLLFSCLRDKDLREMAQILFPLFDASPLPAPRPVPRHGSKASQETATAPGQRHIVLAPIPNPRAASLEELTATAAALDTPVHPAASPAEALALARQLTPPEGLIVVTGSIYLVGAIRELATSH